MDWFLVFRVAAPLANIALAGWFWYLARKLRKKMLPSLRNDYATLGYLIALMELGVQLRQLPVREAMEVMLAMLAEPGYDILKRGEQLHLLNQPMESDDI